MHLGMMSLWMVPSRRVASSVSRTRAVHALHVRPPRRTFATGSTLDVVVRELIKQGRLSTPHDSSSSGFVDIDGEMMGMSGVRDEGVEESRGSARSGIFGVSHHDARMMRDAWGAEESAGEEGADEEEDEDLTASERRESAQRASTYEDISHLTEEELRERVRKSIEELVPSDTNEAVKQGLPAGQNHTPAQLFYLENRDRLVSRAQNYYLEKQREQLAEGHDAYTIQDEWRYYHDPVVRPKKGHLWSVEGEETSGSESSWLATVESHWPKGQLPTVDMIVELLRAEQARDLNVIDLHACGRPDVGTHAIVATGMTPNHCRRMGDITAKAARWTETRHTECFCFASRNDQWVVAHCGPVKVHLFTPDARQLYKVEVLWQAPHEFFEPDDFPHYQDILGTGSDSAMLGYVQHSSGSRSTSALPAPFRDDFDEIFEKPDYNAADDAHYIASSSRSLRNEQAHDAVDTHGSWSPPLLEENVEVHPPDEDTDTEDDEAWPPTSPSGSKAAA